MYTFNMLPVGGDFASVRRHSIWLITGWFTVIMNNTDQATSAKTFDLALFIIESIILLPTILGNILLIYCVSRYKKLHTRSYILIANLAASDLLFALIFLPYDMSAFGFPEIRKNKLTCLLRNVLLLTFVGASVFNLLVISFERYLAIAYPLWHLKLSRRWLIVAIVSSWSLSTFISVLPLSGWNSWNSSRRCIHSWFTILTGEYKTILFFTYTTSVFISFVLFVKVVTKALTFLNESSTTTGDINIRRLSARRLQRSIEKTKLLLLVLGLFVLCWGPYCMIDVLDSYIFKGNDQIDSVKRYSGLLALCNSGINWIVYGLKNDNIRHAFKLTLCKWKKSSTGLPINESSIQQLSQVSSLSL